jgi:hypothetical protein
MDDDRNDKLPDGGDLDGVGHGGIRIEIHDRAQIIFDRLRMQRDDVRRAHGRQGKTRRQAFLRSIVTSTGWQEENNGAAWASRLSLNCFQKRQA